MIKKRLELIFSRFYFQKIWQELLLNRINISYLNDKCLTVLIYHNNLPHDQLSSLETSFNHFVKFLILDFLMFWSFGIQFLPSSHVFGFFISPIFNFFILFQYSTSRFLVFSFSSVNCVDDQDFVLYLTTTMIDFLWVPEINRYLFSKKQFDWIYEESLSRWFVLQWELIL